MKSNHVYMFFVVLGVIVFGIVIFFFVRGIIFDRQEMEKKAMIIQKNRYAYDDEIVNYNKLRGPLKVTFREIYSDQLNEKYQNIHLLLEKLEGCISRSKEYILAMDENCGGRFFTDASINGICLGYKVEYEEMVNVFINDVYSFNQLVDSYNINHSNKLEKFSSLSFGDYIDYNGDGNYSGKEG